MVFGGYLPPLVERYRLRFKQFRLRRRPAFASQDLYEFC